MVLLKPASDAAARFYEYVLGDAARGIFRKHGYAVPE
jgi:ABC-type molybdate transport system substrate-binding protein